MPIGPTAYSSLLPIAPSAYCFCCLFSKVPNSGHIKTYGCPSTYTKEEWTLWVNILVKFLVAMMKQAWYVYTLNRKSLIVMAKLSDLTGTKYSFHSSFRWKLIYSLNQSPIFSRNLLFPASEAVLASKWPQRSNLAISLKSARPANRIDTTCLHETLSIL